MENCQLTVCTATNRIQITLKTGIPINTFIRKKYLVAKYWVFMVIEGDIYYVKRNNIARQLDETVKNAYV